MKTCADHPDAELVNVFTGTANREGLAQCMALSETVCRQLALSNEDEQAVRLAVEEACVNVVNHGYKGQEPGLLQLEFRLADNQTLQARIGDQAKPFFPNEAPTPDLLADVDDRPIGGLGWMLIRQMMPPVDYISDAHGNTLILQRVLQQPVAAQSPLTVMNTCNVMPSPEADTAGAANPAQQPKVRVALFGSFYRGLHVLKALLQGKLSARVEVVGVATDDPAQPFVSPHKRVWQYPHDRHEELMVRQCAEASGIHVYQGRVKTPEFYALFEGEWRPDLCIMATFGQRIDSRLHQFPRLGFFNIHPCIDDGWPSRYVGGNPFAALRKDGHRHAVLALHRVDDGFDTGSLVAYSERVALPEEATVVDLHRLTAPVAAALVTRELGKLIDQAASEVPSGAA